MKNKNSKLRHYFDIHKSELGYKLTNHQLNANNYKDIKHWKQIDYVHSNSSLDACSLAPTLVKTCTHKKQGISSSMIFVLYSAPQLSEQFSVQSSASDFMLMLTQLVSN